KRLLCILTLGLSLMSLQPSPKPRALTNGKAVNSNRLMPGSASSNRPLPTCSVQTGKPSTATYRLVKVTSPNHQHLRQQNPCLQNQHSQLLPLYLNLRHPPLPTGGACRLLDTP